MKLENEFLRVEIAEHGAELTRIFNKKTEEDVLWEADAKYWKRHAPVLFPNVGKTYRHTVKIKGVQYPTCQHGFARDSEFTCIYADEQKAAFLLASTDETKKVYPYDFQLIITYILEANTIKVKWEVKNPSDETIYFTIGGHPAFRFGKPHEKKEDYMLRFPGKEKLSYVLINPEEETVDNTAVSELKLEQECYPLTEQLFARDALIFDHTQIEEVWLCRKNGTPYVGVKAEDFPNFGIWSVKDAPFVCLEPWMGRCDNIGFNQELSQKENVNRARAGESFQKEYQIVIG